MSEEDVVELGLTISELSEDEILRICELVQEVIEDTLRSKIGDRLLKDYNVTLRVESKEDKSITFTVDLSIAVPKELGLDYEMIIEEALSRAFNVIEMELKKHVKIKSKKYGEDTTGT